MGRSVVSMGRRHGSMGGGIGLVGRRHRVGAFWQLAAVLSSEEEE